MSTFFLFYSTVGNKNDCPEKKVVETEDATKFAEQMGIQLFETSAKENINVEEVNYKPVNFQLNKTSEQQKFQHRGLCTSH